MEDKKNQLRNALIQQEELQQQQPRQQNEEGEAGGATNGDVGPAAVGGAEQTATAPAEMSAVSPSMLPRARCLSSSRSEEIIRKRLSALSPGYDMKYLFERWINCGGVCVGNEGGVGGVGDFVRGRRGLFWYS